MKSRWRSSLAAIGLLLISASTNAQERLPTRVLASGNGAIRAPLSGIDSQATLEARLSELGWRGEPMPRLDFARQRVVLLALGAGRGVPLTVTQVGRSPARFVRVAGSSEAPVVAARWAIVALSRQRSTAPIWFETDCVLAAGVTGVRRLAASSPMGMAMRPVVEPVPLQAPQPATNSPIGLASDRVTFEALVASRLTKAGAARAIQALGGLDFRESVVVLLPATVDSRGQGRPVQYLGTAVGSLVRYSDGEPMRLAGAGAAAGWLFRLPRRNGELQCERRVDADGRRLLPTARFVVPQPRLDPVLGILRVHTLALPGPGRPLATGGPALRPELSPQRTPRHQTVCRRATTIAEWRDLRREVSEVSDLPVDWCDFDREAVIVVVNPAGSRSPDLRFAVVEEEGVDVVTITEVAPAADAAPCANGCAILVPKRPGQLAIVLRDARVPRAPVETTLRVFPGDGR